MISKVKDSGFAALKALFMRRHVIICVVGAAAIVLALWLLLPLIPRTAKPEHYRVGELDIKSITGVVGYRKVTGVTQSLSGTGRAEAGSYSYRAGKAPRADMEAYCALLQQEYGAVLADDSQLGERDGVLHLTLPSDEDDRLIMMEIEYDAESYAVKVEEKPKPKEKQESEYAVNVTPEKARELVMTLTKQETGFKSDISVYTTELEPDTVNVDGWDYYVFTVIADYSATRIEYRGTFYVGCYDGVVLSYDKETGVTSRLRGANGAVEEEKQG